ncbi:MAG: tRNA (adenosine(37)-N6)-threonylcarbamoyltransferase complex transferase subunit TsaD [Verrucomicrobiota bacterium]
MIALGIETSCDETSVAVVAVKDNQPEILAQEISSQIKVHRPFGGVVPELATRQHLLHIEPMFQRVLKQANMTIHDLHVIGVTQGPGLASSLLIGLSFAKALSIASNIPWLGINHLEGHLISPFLSQGILPHYPHIGLIISGGNTQIIHVKDLMQYDIIGSTRDDAVGEAYDKVAKMLNMPYPGGPQIETHAKNGNVKAINLPRAMLNSGDLSFSFSGLKTAIRVYLKENPQVLESENMIADLCASFQQAVIDVLIAKTFSAAMELGIQTVTLSGGVSCNKSICEAFLKKAEAKAIKCLVTQSALSTDNASMIALVAALHHQSGQRPDWSADINPNLRLTPGWSKQNYR